MWLNGDLNPGLLIQDTALYFLSLDGNKTMCVKLQV